MFLRSSYHCINVSDIVTIEQRLTPSVQLSIQDGESVRVVSETVFTLRGREQPLRIRCPLEDFTLVPHPVAVPMCFGSMDVEHA